MSSFEQTYKSDIRHYFERILDVPTLHLPLHLMRPIPLA